MQPRRACVFCGRQDLSKEHVWPTWFGKAMRDAGPVSVSGLGRDRTAPDPAALTVRRVCISCNTGWMRELEDAAQPILLPLLAATGGRHELDRQGQRTLATWSVLKAMMLNLASPNGSVVPASEYERFRAQQRPSGGVTCVWIGAYKGSRLAARGTVKLGVFADSPDHQEPDGYLATMNLYRFVVQVFDCFANGRFSVSLDRRGMLRIWPPKDDLVLWPPDGLAFNDHELSLLDVPPTVSIAESEN